MKRAHHSKLVNKLKSHMVDNGRSCSQKVLKVYRSQLAEISNDCSQLDLAYARTLGHGYTIPDRESPWIAELVKTTKECLKLIEADLFQRRGETTTMSSKSSMSSSLIDIPSSPAQHKTEHTRQKTDRDRMRREKAMVTGRWTILKTWPQMLREPAPKARTKSRVGTTTIYVTTPFASMQRRGSPDQHGRSRT